MVALKGVAGWRGREEAAETLCLGRAACSPGRPGEAGFNFRCAGGPEGPHDDASGGDLMDSGWILETWAAAG